MPLTPPDHYDYPGIALELCLQIMVPSRMHSVILPYLESAYMAAYTGLYREYGYPTSHDTANQIVNKTGADIWWHCTVFDYLSDAHEQGKVDAQLETDMMETSNIIDQEDIGCK